MCAYMIVRLLFFKQKTAYEMRISDWSSDVCSSDLAAWDQSLAEAQAESAEIWSRFSEVAAENPGAWIRKPASPAEILAVTERNRPIAFPYSKLMVANSSVNQGAGFIVASIAEARRRGIAEDRLIHLGMEIGRAHV